MKKRVEDFLVLLRELQKIDPEFPLQYAVCLSEIALDEGLSLTALSEKTSMPLSTVSRIVAALSEQRKKGKAYGLIRVTISATERRRKEIHLNDKGREAIKSITDVLV